MRGAGTLGAVPTSATRPRDPGLAPFLYGMDRERGDVPH